MENYNLDEINQCELDVSSVSNTNEEDQFLDDVDERYVPKIGVTFNTLEEVEKFYKDYAKYAGFSTKIRNSNRKGNEIRNQLITCSREGNRKSGIPAAVKTNPTSVARCPARIYVFWTDARSRTVFEYFGDVVSFDTTYNMNRYDLPFASFVGVNHHGHSVLLGCALMKNKDTESFKWLF